MTTRPTYSAFADIPSFTPFFGYEVDVSWIFLAGWLDQAREGTNSFDVNPDFQRGHVWSRGQQIAYVEFCLRGGESARRLYWNCPSYTGRGGGGNDMVLVDGLQRLTAVTEFMSGDLPAFGTRYRDYRDEMRRLTGGTRLRMCVNNLATRAEILRWYLEMNDGGVVHTREELDRVAALLDKETQNP